MELTDLSLQVAEPSQNLQFPWSDVALEVDPLLTRIYERTLSREIGRTLTHRINTGAGENPLERVDSRYRIIIDSVRTRTLSILEYQD